jgi:hypothetical protein
MFWLFGFTFGLRPVFTSLVMGKVYRQCFEITLNCSICRISSKIKRNYRRTRVSLRLNCF